MILRDNTLSLIASPVYRTLPAHASAWTGPAGLVFHGVRKPTKTQFVEFLGDPDLKEVLSSQMGIDWFRQYLVIEFAEEGLDLWETTRDMLERSCLKSPNSGDASNREGRKERFTEVGNVGANGGGSQAMAREGEEFDIRKTGKEIFERFIKSGCGAECNLPGTVIKKVYWAGELWGPKRGKRVFIL